MEMRKIGAPPLAPEVVSRLLDLLCTDDEFRALFEADVAVALRQAGHAPPENPAAADVSMCLTLPAGTKLASKERISHAREKLQAELLVPVSFMIGHKLKA